MLRRTATLALLLVLVVVPSAARAAVLPGHPRIWLSATGRRGITPATLRARCASATSPYARACRGAAPLPTTDPTALRDVPHPLINLAVRYVLFDDESVLPFVRTLMNQTGPLTDLGDPHGQIHQFAPRVRQLAVTYDWLYAVLTPAERAVLEGYLRAYGDWYMAHEPEDVFDNDAYVQAASVALVGLALAGEATADLDARRFLAYAERRWKTVLLPALAYTRDWWHEGPALFNTVVARNALYWATAWSTATDEDAFAYARGNGDVFNHFVRYEVYAPRPDFRHAPWGAVTDQQRTLERETRPTLDMLAWGTGSTVAQAFADEVSRRVRAASDYQGVEAWHQLLFYDPARPASPSREDLPTAHHFSPTAQDVVIMRSGWDPTDTWVSLSCGDHFSPYQRSEVGALQVFRGGPLVGSTGYYDGFETSHWINWYAQHSVHASTLAIQRPGELFPNARRFPNLNTGGQRTFLAEGGRRTLDEYRTNLTAGRWYETGSVTAFETLRYHDYVACDATRAYNSTAFAGDGNTAKVSEVTRQVVFLRPELVVVFDRVESTDPAYEKRFVLHALARPLLTGVDGFSIARDRARLLGRTLEPANAERAVITGFSVDNTDQPPLVMGTESTGARLEVRPRAPAARAYFLHVLDATDLTRAELPPLSRVEDGDLLGARVADPAGERVYTVLFRRTGAPGGTILVQSSDGRDLYRGTLGAGGTIYAPTLDGGVTDAGPRDAGGDADADAGTPPRPDAPDCSCHAGANAPTPAAWALLAAGALALARRRAARR